MAHAEGWMDAYEALDEGREVPPELLATVLGNRNNLGESMLHWYAIEGEPRVVKELIALGFDVNTTNTFGSTPLCECAQIGRWDMIELLVKHGARTDIRDCNGEDVFEVMELAGRKKTVGRLKELLSQAGGMENSK